MTIRKQLATTVRYGDAISRGKYVYVAYSGDTIACVAATAGEARRRYRTIYFEWASAETRRRE